ncbi:M15 family metallopeptidase [Psychrobacter ciconiae]|uniref:M15 family metallopeptidase n=1 Tax=Psychrobacter ciconiae TaxID=1553449 RepID=UPI0019181E91|nr:M15 family metallopeptidase [Psychrobacter ciconiae]
MTLPTIPNLPQFSWQATKQVPIVDSDEALIPIPNHERLTSYPIYFAKKIPDAIDICVARSSVVKRLQQAVELLPKHLGIVVLDGWRSRMVQSGVQDDIRRTINRDYAQLTQLEQEQLLLDFVAPVIPDFISPHLTGGAVDVTLFDTKTGDWVDLGSEFDEPTTRSHTHYYESFSDSEACYYRRLLYHVMTQVGFTNLPTEWWHFDFGNALWALYSGQDKAIYGAASWGD